MDSTTRLVQPSLAELLDRLSIEQIREICDAQDRASHEEEIAKLEHDLDHIFTQAGTELDARFIRLVIALAQVNLHIWHTKVIMQTEPARFQECMKLAHQINGLRNQLKIRINESAWLGQRVPEKTNVDTDNLEGWTMAILSPQ